MHLFKFNLVLSKIGIIKFFILFLVIKLNLFIPENEMYRLCEARVHATKKSCRRPT